ncbi:Ig-like domain-containing protein [Neobacillus kokaensis]|uniref:BIG2 domain-containing protein n=1 Tax=Neobacillus kokaensis TaxID=2759023 RepID=A0ABQ3N5R3_9BACI|nr:Ig-like domain-containing protein [Neobacillus kokaensis]GHI00015.1 hypothetical protein AM1BK_35570 [Neobacillus kokaensis]
MKKKNGFFKVIVIMMLLLSLASGGKVQASGTYSFGDGTYTVGKEITAGLTKFSISEGSASISITRGSNSLIYETLSDNLFSLNQFTASLKNGDEIEVYLDYDAANITAQTIAAVDLKNISAGFYEVGSDLPAGTYTVQLNHPEDDYDSAYFTILDSNNAEKDYFSLYSDDEPFDYKLSNGDKVYISSLRGTLSLKEKILVPQSITVNKSSLSLMVNRTARLIATVQPSTAINKGISWTSANPEIATVDTNGNVNALKVGSTTITVTAKGAPAITKTIPVTVTKVVPTGLKLSKSALNITKNQTVKVTAAITPADAANKTVLWKTSNTKAATVDANGNIKGIANGTAVITATAADNTKVFKKVTVKVATKTVKVTKTKVSVTAGKTVTLTAVVSPSDSMDKTVKWKSSNTKIATVDSKGKVTCKKKGTAIITATVKGAKAASVKVTVTPPVAAKAVKVSKTSITLSKGKTYNLKATVSPSNTTNKTLKWKSSNTKVAKVDSKGKVTAVGAGTATITAATTNGKKATVKITVPYVKSLSAGKWKAGSDLPAGRYKITTNYGSGNLFIGMGTDRFVNEILSSEDDGFGVTVVTTDIKAGDSIEILGLNSVQFTRVKNVKSNTLHSGYWTVGKDINPGRYRITTTSESGNLIIERGSNLLVNEILTNKPDYFGVTSVTTTLKTGDRIMISGLDRVVFTKK